MKTTSTPASTRLEIVAAEPSPSRRPGSWSTMEARLTTARVEDLLTDAEHRLHRLASTEELGPEVSAAVEETLASVRQGLARMGSARRCLRAAPTDAVTPASPLRIVHQPTNGT